MIESVIAILLLCFSVLSKISFYMDDFFNFIKYSHEDNLEHRLKYKGEHLKITLDSTTQITAAGLLMYCTCHLQSKQRTCFTSWACDLLPLHRFLTVCPGQYCPTTAVLPTAGAPAEADKPPSQWTQTATSPKKHYPPFSWSFYPNEYSVFSSKV